MPISIEEAIKTKRKSEKIEWSRAWFVKPGTTGEMFHTWKKGTVSIGFRTIDLTNYYDMETGDYKISKEVSKTNGIDKEIDKLLPRSGKKSEPWYKDGKERKGKILGDEIQLHNFARIQRGDLIFAHYTPRASSKCVVLGIGEVTGDYSFTKMGLPIRDEKEKVIEKHCHSYKVNWFNKKGITNDSLPQGSAAKRPATIVPIIEVDLPWLTGQPAAPTREPKYWIYSVDPPNWDVVKRDHLWASKADLDKIKKMISPGDKVIFYLKDDKKNKIKGGFVGAFNFTSDWYKIDTTKEGEWIQEKFQSRWPKPSQKFLSEIKLELLRLGNVSRDIVEKLEIFKPWLAKIPKSMDIDERKKLISSYKRLILQGSQGHPANSKTPIPESDFNMIFNIMNDMQPSGKNDYKEYLDALDWKKNLILYGSPGTGKTYHANKIADELVSKNHQMHWLDCATRVLLEAGESLSALEISDTILNKNYRKPGDHRTPEESVRSDINESIRKGKSRTIFKKGREAKEKTEYGLKTTSWDNAISAVLLTYGPSPYKEIERIIYEKKLHAKVKTAHKTIQSTITENIRESKINNETPTYVATSTPGVYGLAERNPSPNLFKQNITFHQSYSYEEFMEGIRVEVEPDDPENPSSKKHVNYVVKDGIFKTFCDTARYDKENYYVMIIDEINRGNISKIFGELITIIEKDKRGTDVTLPYSRDTFNVPLNVYIIGTMNTADRSIAHIDTALARRFARDEFMPDSSVLKKKDGKTLAEVEGITLKDILDKINANILAQNDDLKDQQIGHSYLMNGKFGIDNKSDLRRAFVYDILPRLRELGYVYEIDLKNILGGKFIDSTGNVMQELKKSMVDKGTNHADDRFLKELNDFMNPKKAKQEKDDGKTENTDV